MNWSFNYVGPKDPTVDADCLACVAAKMKACARKRDVAEEGCDPRHSKSPDPGCTECRAAVSSHCPSHCGIEGALAQHDAVTAKTSASRAAGTKSSFDAVSVLILAECAGMPAGCSVSVHAYGNDGAHERTADGLEIRSHNLRNLVLDVRASA